MSNKTILKKLREDDIDIQNKPITSFKLHDKLVYLTSGTIAVSLPLLLSYKEAFKYKYVVVIGVVLLLVSLLSSLIIEYLHNLYEYSLGYYKGSKSMIKDVDDIINEYEPAVFGGVLKKRVMEKTTKILSKHRKNIIYILVIYRTTNIVSPVSFGLGIFLLSIFFLLNLK